MDDWYLWALAGGAVIAAALAWNVPRAVLWIALGALSFVASSWWSDAGLPYGAIFGAATNFAICFALYAAAQLKWELRLWNCFHLMIVIDLLYLSGLIKSHYDFAVGLEVANWLALLVVGTVGLMERAGYGPAGLAAFRSRAGWARVVRNRLWKARSSPPFWLVQE
jgi:hypothetical protein